MVDKNSIEFEKWCSTMMKTIKVTKVRRANKEFARGKIMKKEQEIQMLKEFSDANSTSGFEEEFVKLFSAYAKNTANITGVI